MSMRESIESSAPRLRIPTAIHAAMLDHCRREAPLEACGILGGMSPLVSSIHPLRNAKASETRYEADSRDLIAAHLDLRKRGVQLLAIYHSHPQWPALPSRTDLETNYYGDVPRIIVSLLPATPEVRVWRLDAESYEELIWELDSPDVEGGSMKD
jgi:proteasome lid subunit RPN8/RPN11